MKAELKPYAYRHRTHGYSVDYHNLFLVWETMRGRCQNPNREKYKHYGARGIKVCDEWNLAKNFCSWALKNGYKQGLQIDRINNDGDYEPSNCRWVTAKENSRNRRNTKFLTLFGETKCVAEWCETLPISQFTIYWWYKKLGKECTESKIKNVIANKAFNRRVSE